MKKIIYASILSLLLAGINSCNLDTNPTTSVSEDIVFDNTTNAEKVLNGTWRYLMDSYFTYANPGWYSLMLASDAMGNDVAVQPGKYGYLSHYSFTNVVSTSSTTVLGIWTRAYRVIDNTNQLITRIDGIPGDAELKARVKAQAYALRGYIYLNLATYFAGDYAGNADTPAVPIYTKPTSASTQGAPKATLKEVYQQAEDDLLNAYNAIGSYKRERKHKIDKNVIAGILARLYLQKSDWVNAHKYAKEAHTGYVWMSGTDYLAGFNNTSNSEWIWGHGQTTDQNTASYSFNFLDVSSESSYYYSFMADPYFKDLFDENDIRSRLFEWDTKRYKGGLMYKKFRFRADKTADITLMRKAEMVLIEAEALAEQDQLSQAIAKLNELRSTRGANTPDLSAFTKEQLIEEILIERRKELFGEGFGLYDIKRRRKSVERKEATGKVPDIDVSIKGHTVLRLPTNPPTAFAPDSPYYIFAIPSNEETNNPNL